MDVEIKKLSGTTDKTLIPALAGLHMEIFKGLPSTSLGKGYIEDFYRRILSLENCVCFVAYEKGIIAGFVCGTLNAREFSEGIIHKFIVLLKIFLKVMSFRISPLFVADAAQFDSWKKKTGLKAELLSIIVRPQYRGRGIAGKLVDALSGFFRERSVSEYCVFTADLLNKTVSDFYRKLGFQIRSEFPRKNYKNLCFSYKIF